MNRLLLAWVPIRGTFWSGLTGGCVTHWRIDKNPTTTIAVRTRVTLDQNAWLPGNPSEFARRIEARVPTVDDGIPIKDRADVFVEPYPGLRGRTLLLRVESTRIADVFAPDPEWNERSFVRDRVSVKLARDLDGFQTAPPRCRAELFGAGATIGWDIDGIQGPTGSIDFAVGTLVHFKENDPILVEMFCDSVYIDVNRREMELVWRGIYMDPTWGDDVERIILGVLPTGLDEHAQTALLEEGLSRAIFTFAAISDDIEKHVAPPPLRDEEITMARLSSWENGPGAPLLSADEFAQISSVLALETSSDSKAKILAAHEFDEIAWSREQWAQGERVANESAALPDDIGDDDGEANIEVKPARSRVVLKKNLDIADYARLSAHIEVRDPARVLDEAKLSVGEFVAIEESMSDVMEEDARLAAEYERLLPTYRDEAARAHEADLARLGFDLEEEGIPQ